MRISELIRGRTLKEEGLPDPNQEMTADNLPNGIPIKPLVQPPQVAMPGQDQVVGKEQQNQAGMPMPVKSAFDATDPNNPILKQQGVAGRTQMSGRETTSLHLPSSPTPQPLG